LKKLFVIDIIAPSTAGFMLRTQGSKHWVYCVRLRSKLLNTQQVLFFLPVKPVGDVSETLTKGIQL